MNRSSASCLQNSRSRFPARLQKRLIVGSAAREHRSCIRKNVSRCPAAHSSKFDRDAIFHPTADGDKPQETLPKTTNKVWRWVADLEIKVTQADQPCASRRRMPQAQPCRDRAAADSIDEL